MVWCFTRQIQALASYIALRVNSNRHLTGWEVGFFQRTSGNNRDEAKRLLVTCTKTVLVHGCPIFGCSMGRDTRMCLRRHHHCVLIRVHAVEIPSQSQRQQDCRNHDRKLAPPAPRTTGTLHKRFCPQHGANQLARLQEHARTDWAAP